MKLNEIYNKLIKERIEISTLPKNAVLLTNGLDSSGGTFLLFDINNKKAIGYISIGYIENGDVFSVGGIYSEHGYGPLLYEIAMTYVYPNGIAPSQDGGTSYDAQIVWENFINRGDVKKNKIDRVSLSDKEEDLISGCDGNEECLEMAQKVIKLHNIKFSYSFGKDKLNELIKIGNEYIKQNPMTQLEYNSLLWGLE